MTHPALRWEVGTRQVGVTGLRLVPSGQRTGLQDSKILEGTS